jgi:hypothetical protein
MKTKYIILTISILFSICKPTQAQNDEGSFFDGLQETLIEAASNSTNPAVRDKLRKFMLGKGDIQMWMNAEYEKENPEISYGKSYGIWTQNEAYKSQIYGEFDWDNKALMMKSTTTAYDKSYLIILPGIATGDKAKNPEETIVQYTDKDGYWYVPYDDPNGVHDYIKFNAKQAAIGAIKDFQTISPQLQAADGVAILMGIHKNIDWSIFKETGDFEKALGGKKIMDLLKDGKQSYADLQKKLKEALKVLYDKKMAETVGFPVFIHWALMYSPDYIRARETVHTDKYDCNGKKNGCTKLTVTSSGENKDKYMEFDQYDRLTYINSLKEGTVRFAYGKDLTVNLPPAITLGSMIGGIEVANAKSENDKKRWESYFEAQALKKEVERKREIERLRKEELEKLEEQLKEAVTPQEREEIQQKIKDLKELIEKENN